MLSPFAKPQWMTAGGVGIVIAAGALLANWWPLALLTVPIAVGFIGLFRDPRRSVPQMRSLIVSCADGKVAAIETLEAYEPFAGPAIKLTIQPRITDVHVIRAPRQGAVVQVTLKPVDHGPPPTPAAAHVLTVHPTDREPTTVVRMVAGKLASPLICATTKGDVLQRGQRFGQTPVGSTVELYLARPDSIELRINVNQTVRGGSTVIAAER